MPDYRRATADDVETLTRLRVEMLCAEEDYSAEFAEKLRSNTARYIRDGFADGSFAAWVAGEGGEIVGMCGMAFFSLPPNDWCPGGKTAYLGNMYTVSPHRGRGIATRLLALAVEEAKARGCERILLHATEAGRPLYAKFGFQPSDTAMAYFPFGIRN